MRRRRHRSPSGLLCSSIGHHMGIRFTQAARRAAGTLAAMSKLAPALAEAVCARYHVDVRSAKPLRGGYDVWAESWRLESDDRGPLVLRADRSVSPQTATWISDVTRRAAESGAPCCLPLHGVDGAVAFSTGGATVTVRPFVEGRGLDRDNPAEVRAAGETLGLLHGAVAGAPSDRPEPSPWDARFWSGDHDPPTLRDAQLDAWHAAFTPGGDGAFAHRVIHGDFWADNVVWSAGRVAAVIDWSEARVDVLARELAWATWEFGHDETSRDLDIDRARTFLAGYHAVRGPWEPGLADVFIPLMRVALRMNALLARRPRRRRVQHGPPARLLTPTPSACRSTAQHVSSARPRRRPRPLPDRTGYASGHHASRGPTALIPELATCTSRCAASRLPCR